jgi:hypothetical protein
MVWNVGGVWHDSPTDQDRAAHGRAARTIEGGIGNEREGHGMRFTVQRDALAEAVTWVARALPTRPVVPVLAGLLLRAEREDQANGSGWLTASCFDYEVSARMRVRADVAEPGVFLVPGRLLVEILRSRSSSATTPMASP